MAKVLKVIFGLSVAVLLLGVFAVFVLDVPVPWKKARADEAPPPPPRPKFSGVELAAHLPHTLAVPEHVRQALGSRKGDKDILYLTHEPTRSLPLTMPGSTALDPARIIRIRARFAPGEAVKIGETRDFSTSTTSFRELRPGDEVKVGQELGVFHSVEAGNKKNDLFEAIVQLRLDQIILDKAEMARGALPEVFLWNAIRNVQTDRSVVIRAKNMLKVWSISDEDIRAVEKEAEELSLEQKRGDYKSADWGEKQDRWARVVLKAPCDGVIVERNVAKGELVVDNTINLFTIAQVDRMAVLVNIPEDELPRLQSLSYDQRKWSIQTVGVNPIKGLPGSIDEIGYLIDPNMHTAIIKGYIDNPRNERKEHALRAGQFVSATVNMPAPKDVVEIPAVALVEDGRQSVVFVQTNAAKGYYTMRRVVVTQRLDGVVFVRSTPLPEAEQLTTEEKEEGLLPRQPLRVGEPVLTSGVLELKAALEEKEARQVAEDK